MLRRSVARIIYIDKVKKTKDGAILLIIASLQQP